MIRKDRIYSGIKIENYILKKNVLTGVSFRNNAERNRENYWGKMEAAMKVVQFLSNCSDQTEVDLGWGE